MSAPAMDYVEFSVSDIARTKVFYTAIFGWEFTDYGPEYTSFVDNGLGGGFRSDAPPRPGGPLMVFHVDDLEACFERAKNTGAPIEAVGKIYAQEIIKSAPAGTWFLGENGQWTRK